MAVRPPSAGGRRRHEGKQVGGNVAPSPKASRPTKAAKATKAKAVKAPSADVFTRASTSSPSGVLETAAVLAHGVSPTVARAGLARALSTELLVSTGEETEALAAQVLARMRKGSVDGASIVQGALAKGGPLAVAELASALTWRINATAADGADEKIVEHASCALAHIVDAGVDALASFTPRDAREALANTIAQSALLSCGQTLETAYYAPADGSYAHHFDAFTNEHNLPQAITQLPQLGGAMVGVSGGALQTAAQIGADAAIIADINPEVRDFVIVLAAVAMLVDSKAREEGWDNARLLKEVEKRMLGPERGNGELLSELRQLGMPEPILQRVPAMLRGVYNSSGGNTRHVWFAPATKHFETLGQGSAATQEEAALLLRRLAALTYSGGLVAPVVDLSDAQAVPHLARFVEARKTEVTCLHLSNALDYVLDPKGVLDNLSALPHTEDATVLSSNADKPPDRRIGDWHKPGINSLQVWIGPGGIREQLQLQTKRVWFYLLEAAYLPRQAWEAVPNADSAEGVRAHLDTLVREHYGDDERAWGSLAKALAQSCQLESPPSVEKLRQLTVAPPRSPDEVRALTRVLRPLFVQVARA